MWLGQIRLGGRAAHPLIKTRSTTPTRACGEGRYTTTGFLSSTEKKFLRKGKKGQGVSPP